MSYLHDRKKSRNKLRNIGVGVGIVFLLFYFRTGVWNGLSSFTNFIFKPVINLGNNIGANIGGHTSILQSRESLQLENENLKLELDKAKFTLVNYSVLEEENSKLKEILGRSSVNDNFVLANILSKPNKSLYDTLLIDAGEDKSFIVGDVVYSFGSIPIGKISQTFRNSSKVVLFSTSGEKTDVVISNTGAFMQLVGRGGGNFEMSLPRDFELPEGADIVLPDASTSVLAKVVTIISDPRDAFKKALLASPVNIQQLKFVQVKKSN